MRTELLGSVIVVAIATLTACTSQTTSGQPRPESSNASASSAPASADVAALDTGDYATEPRALAKPATGAALPAIESQRMAEFVTLPAEIDPAMTAGVSAYTFLTKGEFKTFFNNDDRAFTAFTKPDNNGFISGFYGYAADPSRPTGSINGSLKHGVMRFVDSAAAVAAARTLSESRTAPVPADRSDTPFKPLAMPALPGTLGTVGTLAGSEETTNFVSAITPYKDYVLLDEFSVAPDQQAAAISAAGRSLALQKALIDKFPATPPKTPGRTNVLVVDQNKILLYTLANPNTDDQLNDSVLGPRGIAFTFSDPVGTMNVLTEVGSLHNARALSTVFRADTPEGAQKIVEQETQGGAAKVDNAKPVASPPGLPQAKCILVRTTPVCDIAVGRYAAEVGGSNLTDAHQAISAQYKILLKADQSAN